LTALRSFALLRMTRFVLTSSAEALFLRQIAGALQLQNAARHAASFTENGHGGEHAHHEEEREEDYGNDEYRHKTPRPLFSTDSNLATVTPVTVAGEPSGQLNFLSSPSICCNSLFSNNV